MVMDLGRTIDLRGGKNNLETIIFKIFSGENNSSNSALHDFWNHVNNQFYKELDQQSSLANVQKRFQAIISSSSVSNTVGWETGDQMLMVIYNNISQQRRIFFESFKKDITAIFHNLYSEESYHHMLTNEFADNIANSIHACGYRTEDIVHYKEKLKEQIKLYNIHFEHDYDLLQLEAEKVTATFKHIDVILDKYFKKIVEIQEIKNGLSENDNNRFNAVKTVEAEERTVEIGKSEENKAVTRRSLIAKPIAKPNGINYIRKAADLEGKLNVVENDLAEARKTIAELQQYDSASLFRMLYNVFFKRGYLTPEGAEKVPVDKVAYFVRRNEGKLVLDTVTDVITPEEIALIFKRCLDELVEERTIIEKVEKIVTIEPSDYAGLKEKASEATQIPFLKADYNKLKERSLQLDKFQAAHDELLQNHIGIGVELTHLKSSTIISLQTLLIKYFSNDDGLAKEHDIENGAKYGIAIEPKAYFEAIDDSVLLIREVNKAILKLDTAYRSARRETQGYINKTRKILDNFGRDESEKIKYGKLDEAQVIYRLALLTEEIAALRIHDLLALFAEDDKQRKEYIMLPIAQAAEKVKLLVADAKNIAEQYLTANRELQAEVEPLRYNAQILNRKLARASKRINETVKTISKLEIDYEATMLDFKTAVQNEADFRQLVVGVYKDLLPAAGYDSERVNSLTDEELPSALEGAIKLLNLNYKNLQQRVTETLEPRIASLELEVTDYKTKKIASITQMRSLLATHCITDEKPISYYNSLTEDAVAVEFYAAVPQLKESVTQVSQTNADLTKRFEQAEARVEELESKASAKTRFPYLKSIRKALQDTAESPAEKARYKTMQGEELITELGLKLQLGNIREDYALLSSLTGIESENLKTEGGEHFVSSNKIKPAIADKLLRLKTNYKNTVEKLEELAQVDKNYKTATASLTARITEQYSLYSLLTGTSVDDLTTEGVAAYVRADDLSGRITDAVRELQSNYTERGRELVSLQREQAFFQDKDKIYTAIEQLLTPTVMTQLLEEALQQTDATAVALGNLITGYMRPNGFSTSAGYNQALASQAVQLKGRTQGKQGDEFKYQLVITEAAVGKLKDLVVDYIKTHAATTAEEHARQNATDDTELIQ